MIKHMSILIIIQKYLMLQFLIFIQNLFPVLPLCRVQAQDLVFPVGLGRTSRPKPEQEKLKILKQENNKGKRYKKQVSYGQADR